VSEYYTAKAIMIPAGTRLHAPTLPGGLAKQPLTYGFGVIVGKGMDEHSRDGLTHFQIPLDEAIKAGLVEERE
jgi:hypothetical protein